MRRLSPLLLLLPALATADDLPRATAPHAPAGELVAVVLRDGPPAQALAAALKAHACARQRGDLDGARNPDVLTVIDYSLPSSVERLWVIDLAAKDVLVRTHVAHGQNTGDDLARAFSNVEGSHQTSLGVFRTAETYRGQHGRSLRLDGLEPGVNDRARDRAIVVHGADYATPDFVARNGRLGRSWGCPAVGPDVIDPLVDLIEQGSLLVAWYPADRWLSSSSYLHCSN